jgi:hypothetical protein
MCWRRAEVFRSAKKKGRPVVRAAHSIFRVFFRSTRQRDEFNLYRRRVKCKESHCTTILPVILGESYSSTYKFPLW